MNSICKSKVLKKFNCIAEHNDQKDTEQYRKISEQLDFATLHDFQIVRRQVLLFSDLKFLILGSMGHITDSWKG